MLKVGAIAPSPLIFCLPVAFADLSNVKQTDIFKAIESPILMQAEVEDLPGWNVPHFTFRDMVFSTKIEFKGERIDLAWTGSKAPEKKEHTEHSNQLGQRAVAALTQSNDIEVRRVIEDAEYKDRCLKMV